MAGTTTTTRSRIHFMDEMTWKELDRLPRERTIFFLTIAPIQGHGPHLPCGLSGYMSQAFALATAKEFCRRRSDWQAVLTPHLPVGTHTFSMVGSLDTGPTPVRHVLEDWGASLARDGFRFIMVLSAHAGPGHIRAIEDACDRVSKKHAIYMLAPMGPKIAAYLSGAYDEKLQRLARSGQEHSFAQDIHAGRWATSMGLYLRPDLVKPGYTDLKPVLIDPATLGPDSPVKAGEGEGYLGSPGLASAELGKASVESVSRDFTELLLKLLKGEDIHHRVHTPDSGTEFLYEYSQVTIVILAVVALLLLAGLARYLFS